jgi:arsenate reductase
MITLYGIKNCDSVKRARHWLDARQIAYRFYDLRTGGITANTLQQWSRAVGWETLLNRRGTSWRQLPQAVRESVDEPAALALMRENPTLIKRPVLELEDGSLHVGFTADDYAKRL